MTDALLIYGSTFMAVFFLGLQSLNVNQGQYVAAAVTSFFISTGHIFLYRLMPDSGAAQLGAYYAGGITGITASIWSHPRIKAWLLDWQARRRLRAAVKRKLADRPPMRNPTEPPSRGWPADAGDTH